MTSKELMKKARLCREIEDFLETIKQYRSNIENGYVSLCLVKCGTNICSLSIGEMSEFLIEFRQLLRDTHHKIAKEINCEKI